MKKTLFFTLLITGLVFFLFSGCSNKPNILGPSNSYEKAPSYIDPIHLYNYYALRGDEKFRQYEDALYQYSQDYTAAGLHKLRQKVQNLGLKSLFEYIAGKMYEKGTAYYDINYKNTASQYFRTIVQKLPGTSYADESLYYIILCDIPFHDYTDIIHASFDILRRYPASSYHDYAYYSIAISYYKMQDYKNADIYFIDLTQRYPESRYTADSYFWLATIAYKKQDYNAAERYFLYIIKHFPTSRFAASSQRSIDFIVQNNLISF